MEKLNYPENHSKKCCILKGEFYYKEESHDKSDLIRIFKCSKKPSILFHSINMFNANVFLKEDIGSVKDLIGQDFYVNKYFWKPAYDIFTRDECVVTPEPQNPIQLNLDQERKKQFNRKIRMLPSELDTAEVAITVSTCSSTRKTKGRFKMDTTNVDVVASDAPNNQTGGNLGPSDVTLGPTKTSKTRKAPVMIRLVDGTVRARTRGRQPKGSVVVEDS